MDNIKAAEKLLRDALMDKTGCSAQLASKLVKSQVFPSIQRAADIEDKLGIPASAWARKTQVQEMWKIVMEQAK